LGLTTSQQNHEYNEGKYFNKNENSTMNFSFHNYKFY
jgi:hypothetical protein